MSCRKQTSATEKLQENGATVVTADFSTASGIYRFIDDLKSFGPALRAIIHNASDWMAESGEDDPADVLERMVNIHMTAPYLINLHCADLLTNTDGDPADVVHLTDYVVEKGSAKHIAYAASKAGLDNMTRSFARTLAPTVKVNAIAPALLMFNEGDDEAYRRKALDKSVIKKEPGPDPVWQTLLYLFNTPNITGRTLSLDGGRHIR